MSNDPRGFRQGFANVIAAVRGTLATALLDGAQSKEDFAKLFNIPGGIAAGV